MFKHCKGKGLLLFSIEIGTSLFKSALITEANMISPFPSYRWGWLLLLSSLVGFFVLIYMNSLNARREHVTWSIRVAWVASFWASFFFKNWSAETNFKNPSTASKAGVIAGCDSEVALFHHPAVHRAVPLASGLGLSWLFESWFLQCIKAFRARHALQLTAQQEDGISVTSTPIPAATPQTCT